MVSKKGICYCRDTPSSQQRCFFVTWCACWFCSLSRSFPYTITMTSLNQNLYDRSELIIYSTSFQQKNITKSWSSFCIFAAVFFGKIARTKLSISSSDICTVTVCKEKKVQNLNGKLLEKMSLIELLISDRLVLNIQLQTKWLFQNNKSNSSRLRRQTPFFFLKKKKNS